MINLRPSMYRLQTNVGCIALRGVLTGQERCKVERHYHRAHSQAPPLEENLRNERAAMNGDYKQSRKRVLSYQAKIKHPEKREGGKQARHLNRGGKGLTNPGFRLPRHPPRMGMRHDRTRFSASPRRGRGTTDANTVNTGTHTQQTRTQGCTWRTDVPYIYEGEKPTPPL